MVIKLRKFIRSRVLKFIAFSLTVILITVAMLLTLYTSFSEFNPESLFIKNYLQSETFVNRELYRAIHEVNSLLISDEKAINPEPKYLYYISDGETIKQNAYPDDMVGYGKHFYKYDSQSWEYGENAYDNVQLYLDETHTLYLSFPDDYMQEQQERWEQVRAEFLPIIISIIISCILIIIFIIYLITVTGRKPGDDEVHLTPYMDRIYSDIQIGIMLLALSVWVVSEGVLISDFRYINGNAILNMNNYVVVIGTAIMTGIISIICGVILLSLVRKIKARRLINHSLIYTILGGISKFIRSFFDDSRFAHFPLTKSLDRRQVIFTVSSGVMVFLTYFFWMGVRSFFLGFVTICIEAVIIFWYFYENRKTFEEINHGFQSSIQEQMKSERMKLDLITNVSHDLKTPLTSIISYVDLLSKEELAESANDYVNILADKSERLKNIVADLFDLAKSTSGNLPMNLENLDLRKLIEQTLGDMEDEIEKSNVRIKTSLSETPIYIYSDGKKLYRVFQNIIGNALKYSLQGTRVFIDMVIANNNIEVTVKNTASYDMDFTAEDILQRFNRGDESRTGEGSGLGLSIAESFTWACGGNFNVEIDGDQFKVVLGFPVNGTVPGTE